MNTATAALLCLVCDERAPVGSLLCPGCGAPLPLHAPASPPMLARAPGLAPGPAWTAGDAVSLVRLDAATRPDAPRGVRLPRRPGDTLVIGRHDLDAGIVVDVDLRPLTEPVGGGWTFSRRQARLLRDDAGRAWIEALGTAATLWRPPRTSDDAYETLARGTRRPLDVGARLFFGSSSGGLLLEVRAEPLTTT